MGNSVVRLKQRGFGQTFRTDLWWIQPLAVFLGFSAFLVYAHFRVFEGDLYFVDVGGANYLTPFYSPLLFDQPGHLSGHALLKEKPGWIPDWISPAAFILIFPAGFRFTCYYYRGAYYKSFWADPPNCAVGEPRKSYLGENSLPLILQNIHRYFLYAALIFIFILSYDVWLALWFKNPLDGTWTMGVGLGTLILAVNVVLIALYTLGCHSLRHLIGGWRDEMSKSPVSLKAYNCATCLNKRHTLWAWCSLVSVMFADLYVRQCASGAWVDWRIL